MKNLIWLLSIGLLFGCTYDGKSLQSYWEEPKDILKDPHFAEYRTKRENLEREYLNRDITYSEYIEKRDAMEKEYERDIQRRDGIIFDQEL